MEWVEVFCLFCSFWLFFSLQKTYIQCSADYTDGRENWLERELGVSSNSCSVCTRFLMIIDDCQYQAA